MLAADKLINKQIISVADGRIVGDVKDVYLDNNVGAIVGLYLGTEGLLRRSPLIVQHNAVQLYGEDVILVYESDIIVKGQDLAGFNTWVRRSEIQGREIESSSGTKIGYIDDALFATTGQVLGFTITRPMIAGPLSKNKLISREIVTEPGHETKKLVIDMVKAEQQSWAFDLEGQTAEAPIEIPPSTLEIEEPVEDDLLASDEAPREIEETTELDPTPILADDKFDDDSVAEVDEESWESPLDEENSNDTAKDRWDASVDETSSEVEVSDEVPTNESGSKVGRDFPDLPALEDEADNDKAKSS